VRDGNGSDDAMMRRYEGKWRMFAQPDPYDGSYSLTDPQSFNRYSYTQNDPVNFVDPSGLEPCYGAECGWGGFGGWGGGYSGGNGWGGDPRPGLQEIAQDEWDLWPLQSKVLWNDRWYYDNYNFSSLFEGSSPWSGFNPQNTAKDLDGNKLGTCLLDIYHIQLNNIDSYPEGPFTFTGTKNSGKGKQFTLEADLSKNSGTLGFWSSKPFAKAMTDPGWTGWFTPQIYIASDFLDRNFTFVQSLFVYEIGNALHFMTGLGQKPDHPERYGDLPADDVGGQLVDCVYGGRVTEQGTLDRP